MIEHDLPLLPYDPAWGVSHGPEILWNNPAQERRDDLHAAGRVQIAATLRESSKESQDWDARAAQEVEAAQARGEDQGALVDRNERHADIPHRKAEQEKPEASREPHAPGLVEAAELAQAEVPAQHLPAVLGVAAAVSLVSCREKHHTSSTVLHGHEDVTAAHVSRLDVAAGFDKYRSL